MPKLRKTQNGRTHMLCPDGNRTRLLIENVDELSKWLDMDSRTDLELAYWIPKYILMQGNKPFSTMGYMSPKLKALAESQDRIGWKNFTKGHISTQFYKIQTFHLAISSSYLNGSDWTKQFITKILQITHSQWIYQNILLHDKHQGYLHNKKSEADEGNGISCLFSPRGSTRVKQVSSQNQLDLAVEISYINPEVLDSSS
jgi:hypothetical protein